MGRHRALQAKSRDILGEKTLGHSTVMNTRWPIEATLRRVRYRGKIAGYSVQIVCNGVSRHYIEFPTLREARDNFDGLRTDRTV